VRNKFAKLGFISLALAMAFLAVPVSYACVTGQWGNWHPDRPITCCTPQCDVAFTSVSTGDNEGSMSEPKEVAQTTAYITDCGNKKIVVNVNNAYPGYEGYVNFTVKNTGRCPIKITGISTNNPNPGYLQLSLTGECVIGAILQSGDIKSGHLVSGITQQAAQNAIYTFTIEIDFVQYTTCEVGGTPGYWQNWKQHWSCGTLNGWLHNIDTDSHWLVDDRNGDGTINCHDVKAYFDAATGKGHTKKDQFLMQYLATRLNVEAGRLDINDTHNVTSISGYAYLDLANPTSATLAQIIAAMETKYNTVPTNAQFNIMKNICDALNKLRI